MQRVRPLTHRSSNMSERLEKGTFVIIAICHGVPANEMPELPPAGQYMHGIECPGGIVGRAQPAQPAPSLSEIARKIEEIRNKVEALRAAVKALKRRRATLADRPCAALASQTRSGRVRPYPVSPDPARHSPYKPSIATASAGIRARRIPSHTQDKREQRAIARDRPRGLARTGQKVVFVLHFPAFAVEKVPARRSSEDEG